MKAQAVIATLVVALVATVGALAYVIGAGTGQASAEQAVVVDPAPAAPEAPTQPEAPQDGATPETPADIPTAPAPVDPAPAPETPQDGQNPPADQPPADQPPAEAPPAEQPPAEEPPAEEPPAEEPPAEEPPAEEPPAEEPPAEEPPAEEPPAEEPPAEEPPAEEPPADEPPADDPPADEPVNPIHCLIGYTYVEEVADCIFTGCPFGFTLHGDLCVEIPIGILCDAYWYKDTCVKVCPEGTFPFNNVCAQIGLFEPLPGLCLLGEEWVLGDCVPVCKPNQVRVGLSCQDLGLGTLVPDGIPPIIGEVILNN